MIPKHYLLLAEERKRLNRMKGGEYYMNERELIATFKWTGDVGNLLPTEINRILNSCAEQLNKAAGKTIDQVTYDFAGKNHNVTLGAKVPA